MKSAFLIIMLLFFKGFPVFSQRISVELSITWERGYDIFKKDSMVLIPKLHITYRNNSNTNCYFLKISDSRVGLPMIPFGGSIHPSDFKEYLLWRDDYLGRAKKHVNFANQNFYVRVGGRPLFSGDWYVHSDTIDYNKEHEINIINDNLATIYEYIFRDKNVKGDEISKIYFAPSDITPESILDVVKDQFIFLKPNEVFGDTYNLIGFKTVEGCFTFFINQDSFFDFVLTEPVWDNNKSYWVEQRKELPEKVGEYQLYDGQFFTNSVTVDFSGH